MYVTRSNYCTVRCLLQAARDQDSTSDDTLDGCIWLTEEQIDEMMKAQLNNDTADLSSELTSQSSHHRQKRTLVDFDRQPYSKWPMPITYKFDGDHCEL